MQFKAAKFPRAKDAEFIKTLRERVNKYFKTNGLSTHSNLEMVFKTIFMYGIFLGPFFLMIFGVVTNSWLVFLCWMVMGVGVAGLGLSVMHDACHAAYSKNKVVNYIIGAGTMSLLGASALNWKIQHNVLHHSFTNVDHYDEDINPGKVMRFSPNQPVYSAHKFQHIYAWFLYGLMTLMWITTKDFKQLYDYHKRGLLKTQNISYTKQLISLILNKLFYYSYIMVIPFWLMTSTPWYVLILGFIAMHYIAGLTLACIFQLAHVMPDMEYPLPNDEGQLENNWAIHQLRTTTNFAQENGFMTWFVGGLNYQIEHHLFPNICHVHYRKISSIVRDTAKEFDLPYYSHKTFFKALVSHGQMLKQLGRAA